MAQAEIAFAAFCKRILGINEAAGVVAQQEAEEDQFDVDPFEKFLDQLSKDRQEKMKMKQPEDLENALTTFATMGRSNRTRTIIETIQTYPPIVQRPAKILS